MSKPTDLTMNENLAQRNPLKRTHEAAGLLLDENIGRRQAFSDEDDLDSCDGSVGRPSTPGPKPGKKTRGRVKINMEFIDNKLRRYTTFSKRKSGIMKKAHELATLTGTQVMLLVASETGHVYTFATRKLQPILSSEAGKQLIQTCLNSPDPPESTTTPSNYDQQRMSAQGFEEPDLSYAPPEESKEGLLQKTYHNMLNSIAGQGISTTQEQVDTTNSQHSSQPERSNNESPMNLVAVNNSKMAFVTVSNSNPSPSRAQLATILSGNAYIMSGANQTDARSIHLGQNDGQVARASTSNGSSVLAPPSLQPALIHDRIHDAPITLLSSYGSVPRQVPAVQPVIWTSALHAQPIALMQSQSEDKKGDKG